MLLARKSDKRAGTATGRTHPDRVTTEGATNSECHIPEPQAPRRLATSPGVDNLQPRTRQSGGVPSGPRLLQVGGLAAMGRRELDHQSVPQKRTLDRRSWRSRPSRRCYEIIHAYDKGLVPRDPTRPCPLQRVAVGTANTSKSAPSGMGLKQCHRLVQDRSVSADRTHDVGTRRACRLLRRIANRRAPAIRLHRGNQRTMLLNEQQLAEGVGFEPTMRRKPHSGFQDRRHRPLGEPSWPGQGTGAALPSSSTEPLPAAWERPTSPTHARQSPRRWTVRGRRRAVHGPIPPAPCPPSSEGQSAATRWTRDHGRGSGGARTCGESAARPPGPPSRAR